MKQRYNEILLNERNVVVMSSFVGPNYKKNKKLGKNAMTTHIAN